MSLCKEHITALHAIVGPKGVLTAEDTAPLLIERRGRWQGTTPLALAPATTKETAQLIRYCYDHDLTVTPQGGNTGQVGGQVARDDILILTKRMNKIRNVSALNNSIIVEAGVTLAEVQETAQQEHRLFPLSIGSEGSCHIGGNISTNAGGINVLRYGTMRELVLGLEVVLPNGDIWNGLNTLRKNNTGYDLKHLFIGGEGTLGLVTAAALKLFPLPDEKSTVFCSMPSPEAAIELLALFQQKTGGLVNSFELMSQSILDLVLKNVTTSKSPLDTPSPWYGLVELSASSDVDLALTTETILQDAMSNALISNAVIAQNLSQAEAMWALRHNASEAMRREAAHCVKCDISIPVHHIPEFLNKARRVVETFSPAARIIAFGHVGDGNIHYDIMAENSAVSDQFKEIGPTLRYAIHDVACALGGTISAEHGIGLEKQAELSERKSPIEMEMMRAVKKAIDPKGIMNPGKLL
ncbi:MAG: FAD-binding oxidoreductase [bacterium]